LNRLRFSTPQVVLLVWTVAALAVAEYVRHQPLAERTETVAGAIEVVASILTGILFVVFSYRNRRSS
jgi:hypothetical protein